MSFHYILFVSLLFISSSAKRNIVVENFHNEEIVPDLIETSPRQKVTVVFEESGVEVDLGNKLKPSQVQTIPKISYSLQHHKQYYTLAFLDPDAPSRANPQERTFVHWLVGNIPQADITLGETLVSFIGSAPPQNSGDHRYTFLVYKQKCKIQFNETVLTGAHFEERKRFSTKTFQEKYNLDNPYFGNFYLAENEN